MGHLRLFRLAGRMVGGICLLFSVFSEASAQTDRQFWFAAPDVTSGHGDSPVQIRLAAFNNAAAVTISQPANPAFAPILVNVPASTAINVDLTAFLANIETPHNTISSTGILVESTELITAYYEVNRGNNPDIFALKGRNGLGTAFRLPLQRHWDTGPYDPRPAAGAVIVATEDNTTITITPSTNITVGASNTVIRPAGVPFTVVLNKGQSYSMATENFTAANMPAGTLITSNKPVAVTLFHDSIAISGCLDIAGDQLVPVNILGTEYIVMRGFLDAANDESIYVLATEDGTTVSINGGASVATLNAGQSYQHVLPAAAIRTYVTTNKPAYVTHYTGFGCEVGMAVLPPIVCTGSREVYFIRSTDERFGINILVPAGFQDQFRLNGGAPNTDISAASFAPVPGTGGAWVSAQIEVSTNATLNTTIAPNLATQISNDATLFHLGVINGGNVGTGCRYGYFSSFSTVNLGPDINVNYGTTVTLDAGTIFGVSYLWSTGQTTQSIEVGIWNYDNYWVEVDLGSCTLRDTVCVGTVEYVWRGQVSTDYGNADNWSKACDVSAIPTCSDDVIIPGTSSSATVVNYPVLDAAYEARSILIEPGAILGANANGQLRICGDFLHRGTLNLAPNSTITFGGTRPQVYTKTGTSATGTFQILRIDNSTTATSNNNWAHVAVKDTSDDLRIRQQLIFDRGILLTEANREVIVQSRAGDAIIGQGNDRFVAGRLRRHINALGAYDFPVGLAVTPPTADQIEPTKSATLTNANTVTAWITAPVCGGVPGMAFDGTDDFVQLPATVALSGAQPRTVELWAKVDAFNEGGLFQLGDTETAQDFSLRTRSGDNQFRLQFWGGDLDVTLADSKGKWHHYALTYDGTTARIYYDGVLAGVYTLNLNTDPQMLYLGRWRNSYFNGQIAQVKIWNTARSTVEITAGMCQSYDCNTQRPPELIAYYDLREGSGTSLNSYQTNCQPPTLSYQRANVNFTAATSTDNLRAYFERYTTTPGPTGQTDICEADFDTYDALNNGKWRIDAFNSTYNTIDGNTGTYTMTLYPRDYSNAQPRGTVMKRDPIHNTPWQIPTGFCINDAISSPARGGMSGFSEFGIAQTLDIILLPVTLVSLEARPEQAHIAVRWQTTQEKNNAGFEVLRSRDGQSFTDIGFVPAARSPKDPQDYRFDDHEVQPGQRYYYQLRQYDHDGQTSLSRIVSAQLDAGQELRQLRIYPNPTEGQLWIDLNSVSFVGGDALEYRLYDLLGITLQSGTLYRQQTPAQLDLEHLPRGMYFLQVQSPDGQRQVFKVQRF
ncbi:MAG: LamG-like jellyroll fold domain-containing protein [Bernardetiaceae bacterium]